MNEDEAMMGDNDKENQKYSYIGNQYHCYLTNKISTRTGLSLKLGHRSKMENVYRLSNSLWNIASTWRRRESAIAPLW